MDYFLCPKHKKKYEMFCRTCRVPLCKKCSVHKDHLTEKLADFVAKQRGEIPTGEELKGLLGQINNSLAKVDIIAHDNVGGAVGYQYIEKENHINHLLLYI